MYPTAVHLGTGSWDTQASVTITSGDTLLQIARRFGVSTGSILGKNTLKKSDPLFPGMVLLIPDSKWEVWIKEIGSGKNKFEVKLLSG